MCWTKSKRVPSNAAMPTPAGFCDYSEIVNQIDDLRVFASSNSETHRDRNHYTFKVHSLPRPRCIVTIVGSGVDFMVNQRAMRRSSSRVFPRPKRWIVLCRNVRECIWAYPLSNNSSILIIYCSMQRSRMHLGVSALEYTHQSSSSIVPCNVRECIWAVSALEYVRRSCDQSGKEIG
jgi:hypothetical protein